MFLFRSCADLEVLVKITEIAPTGETVNEEISMEVVRTCHTVEEFKTLLKIRHPELKLPGNESLSVICEFRVLESQDLLGSFFKSGDVIIVVSHPLPSHCWPPHWQHSWRQSNWPPWLPHHSTVRRLAPATRPWHCPWSVHIITPSHTHTLAFWLEYSCTNLVWLDQTTYQYCSISVTNLPSLYSNFPQNTVYPFSTGMFSGVRMNTHTVIFNCVEGISISIRLLVANKGHLLRHLIMPYQVTSANTSWRNHLVRWLSLYHTPHSGLHSVNERNNDPHPWTPSEQRLHFSHISFCKYFSLLRF